MKIQIQISIKFLQQSQKSDFFFYGVNINFSLTYQNRDNKMRYKYPVSRQNIIQVNPKQCQHEKTQELNQILQTKRCQLCPKTINSYKDLVMDIRWIANKIMHPDIEFISIIKGHIFHQFTRPREYYEIFNDPNYQQLVEDLFRNHNGKYDFMQLAKEDPQYEDQWPTDELQYDAICQLDFVKIQIPVRHKDCRHVECYELTSLRAYRKQILASNPHQKYMECLCKCQVKIDLNSLEQDLVLDKELLNAIRKSYPHSIKFYINPQNNMLEDEHKFNNNQDLYIREIQKLSMPQIKEDRYKKFEHDILKVLYDIYSRKLGDSNRSEGRRVYDQAKIYEYQNFDLNLEDPFLKSIAIEYPVRCEHCKYINISDIRTYVGIFLINREKYPNQRFQCPLCSYQFKKTYEQIYDYNLIDYIYLDQNLLRRLLEHRQYIHTRKLKYEGQIYMLKEFQKSHKIYASDIEKQLEGQDLEYPNLNCIVSNTRLKVPLQLYNCPLKNYIDFYVFYGEFKKIGYNFQMGLYFCRCQACFNHPIKSINEIFFDELFQTALHELKESEYIFNTTQNRVTIYTKTRQIILSEFIQQPISMIQVKPRQEFLQNFNDADYENTTESSKISKQMSNINQLLGEINVIVGVDGIQFQFKRMYKSQNQQQEDIEEQINFNLANIKILVQNQNQELISQLEFSAQE